MLGDTPLADGRFVAVDIETSGCCPGSSDIIEIGATLIEGGRVAASFASLVRPRSPIPPSIVELTGITDAAVADAPVIEDATRAFVSFAEDAVLVAHNHRFDMGFLDYEAERVIGAPFQRPVLDTLALARRLHPGLERHNLRALAELYTAPTVPTHRATTDAAATAEVFVAMLPELAALGMRTAEDVAHFSGLAREGALARKLVLATHLPDDLGVYLMRDSGGRVIYVGRAKNLRTRVRSYFYYPADHERAALATATASVDHIRCPSDLDALLLESRLLDRYKPPFNQDRQRGRTSVYLRMDDRSRYPALTIVRRRPRTGFAIGPLTNAWAARVIAQSVRAHFGLRLCAKRVNASLVPCRLVTEGCPQPCAGGVTPAEYRGRVAAAVDAFGDGAPAFRVALQAKREHAAAQLRYEEAILYRDALRAFDRTMSALVVTRSAADEPGVGLIESRDDVSVVHLLRYGRHVGRIRMTRDQVANGDGRAMLTRAVRRAYTTDGLPGPDEVPSGELREIFIIDTHRRQSMPIEVAFDGDADEFVDRLLRTLRRRSRVIKKVHAAPLGA